MEYKELFIGQSASMEKKITDNDIRIFSLLSMDYNPLHLDEEFASQSFFRKRIAHGLLVASLISSVIGNKLPGEGTVYLGQDLKFTKPVFIGDSITAKVTVKELRDEKKIAKLETICENNRGEVVIEGLALVKLLK